jgi:hypothetical protein
MGKRPKREPANSHPLSDHKINSNLFPAPLCAVMVFLLVTGTNFISSLDKLAEITILKSAENIRLPLNFRIKMFISLRNNVSGLPKYYGVKITEHNMQEIFSSTFK